jgi:hypothetical protein
MCRVSGDVEQVRVRPRIEKVQAVQRGGVICVRCWNGFDAYIVDGFFSCGDGLALRDGLVLGPRASSRGDDGTQHDEHLVGDGEHLRLVGPAGDARGRGVM